ncbi:hypothetical protein [Agrobacterium tumefaciens]|uniref:hypothetical protein n=1 Tax=Agrobacterium tumefaciens TaxID=358 RepID=UPI001574B702|nr:hypothetical protein [Agrobacterium tumefaciens]WCK02200.1 hypothetical protein G6L31_013340 [Agrobacterium tumefaciens]
MVNERIKESDLIDPAIALIAKFGDIENGLEISVLAHKLRSIVNPTEADLLSLKNRKDDRLSQVIRNLVSHRTLEKRGLAIYRKGDALTRGSYILTELGRASVKRIWAQKLK